MLKKRSTYLVLIILLVIFISSNVLAKDVTRLPRFNFNGNIGEEFIGQAGILYPFRNTEDSLWYTDFRYRISNDDINEWNLGLGYRKKLKNYDNKIAGGYIFKDSRNEYNYDWNMWTIGGELLSDQWDFRVNAYITDDERVAVPQNDEIIVKGQKLYYKEGFLSSMNGYDFEVGKSFVSRKDWLNNIGVYLKIFNFYEENAETISGQQLRIDKQFGDLNKTTWKLGVKWRDDNIRGNETEATFAVSIPFGKGGSGKDMAGEVTPSQIVESRMTEQPERDLDVVVAESEDPDIKEAKNIDGSSLGNVLYVSADGTGDGSSKSKPTNIIELNTLSGEGDVIIFMGDDGIIYPSGSKEYSNYELKNGQKLLSASGELVLASENMDKQTVFSPDVKQAILSNSAANDVLVLADNTFVSGIQFNNGDNIISGSGVSGEVTLTNNKFIKGTYAIYINNVLEDSIDNLKVNITGNDFGDFIDADTIYLSSTTTNKNDVNITGNDFSYSNGNAVELNLYSVEAVNNLVLERNKVLAADSEAFYIELDAATDNTVKINNNYFENIGNSPVYVDAEADNNNEFQIINNEVKLAGDSGLDIDITSNNGSNNIEIMGTSIEMSEDNGFEIDIDAELDNVVDISDNYFGTIREYGIDFSADAVGANNLKLSKNHLQLVEDNGFEIDIDADLDNVVDISDNYFGTIEDDGIDFSADAVGNNTIKFSKNQFKSTDYDGIYIDVDAVNGENDITVVQNTVESSFEEGIYISSDNTNGDLKLLVEENIINSTGEEGINIYSTNDSGNAEVRIQNNVVENTIDYPLEIDANTNGGLYELYITNNSFKNSPDDGINVYLDGNSEHQVNISNNLIENMDDDGIDINMDDITEKVVVNINNNEINTVTGHGIQLYSYNSVSNSSAHQFNITNNKFNNIMDDAVYSYARLQNNLEINFTSNSMNNIVVDGFDIQGEGSTISGEISGNIIDSASYAVRLNANDNGTTKTIFDDLLIFENEFNGTGFAALYFNTFNSDYGSEINVEVNDNSMSEHINMLIQENGDNTTITGNQAP